MSKEIKELKAEVDNLKAKVKRLENELNHLYEENVTFADLISDNQQYLPKRAGEMETTLANIDKIKSVIGWKPEVDVLEWIKNG